MDGIPLATRLRQVQLELKAPKSQYNSFSKYKYRNCEDILEAVKPLLDKYEVTLIISDTLEYLEGRYYIKAQASLYGDKDLQIVSSFAYAREEEAKKGMDAAQITGSASSYARKYALNGLFLIDDTKDADGHDNTKPTLPKAPAKPAPATTPVERKPDDPVTPKEKQQLKNLMSALGMDKDAMGLMIESVLEKPTVDTFGDFKTVIDAMEETE